MTGGPRVRVVQLQRRTCPGHYSMERVFAQVRAGLPCWVDVELFVTSHYNKGLLPTEVVALPIMHVSRTIGILYGDNAEHRAPIDSVSGLEIFLSQAGYAFGNAVFASERAGRG